MIPLKDLPKSDPVPEPRFKVWWAGTEVLKVKVGDEVQSWRRTEAGFRRMP